MRCPECGDSVDGKGWPPDSDDPEADYICTGCWELECDAAWWEAMASIGRGE